MARPRLVASDVDGTLLDPLERVSRRTTEVVRRVVAAGVPFVLVTGRPPRWVTPVTDALGVIRLAVCANGAVVYDVANDRVLDSVCLDPMRLHDAAGTLYRALPGCSIAVERVGDASAETGPFVAEQGYRHAWPDADATEVPRAEVLGHPAVKMLVQHEHLTSAEMAHATRALLDGMVDVTYSTGNGLIELSMKGITKAVGLAKVAEYFDVRPANVIAFGDMPNDLEMLRWAGHGVAMANAHPEVLKVADEITAPNSEDGVALVLERWF